MQKLNLEDGWYYLWLPERDGNKDTTIYVKDGYIVGLDGHSSEENARNWMKTYKNYLSNIHTDLLEESLEYIDVTKAMHQAYPDGLDLSENLVYELDI